MFSDFVICVFSYQRADFLQNLLDSAERFYPEMDIAIFDDGSTDEEMKAVLERMKQKGVYVYVAEKGKADNTLGGFYTNMNVAVKYVCDQNYKYAYFVQDDMQFLWRDEELESRVSEIFKRPDCFMCNFNFLAKLHKKRIELRLPKADYQIYTLNGKGVMDPGVYDVAKIKAIGFHFPYNHENDNGAYWHEKGYNMVWCSVSNIGWLPWPTAYRHGKVRKRKMNVLKPLTKAAIRKLKANNGYTFLEDYTSAASFLLKPYWYSVSPGKIVLLKVYIKYYLGIPLV